MPFYAKICFYCLFHEIFLPHFRRQLCETLVYGDVRLMRIFATILARGVKQQLGVESGQFLMPLVALSSEPLKIRPKLSLRLTTVIFSMNFSLCRYAPMRKFFRKDRHVKLLWCAILVDSHASVVMYFC